MITSIFDYLNFMKTQYSSRTAFCWVDAETDAVISKSYPEYLEDIRRFAAWLMHTVPDVRGKHIGFLADNSYDYAVGLLGTLSAGAAAVPLNLQESRYIIDYQIGFSDVVCILHDGEYAEREEGFADTYADLLIPMDSYRASDWPDAIPERKDPEALAFLLFTSGTTGKSKCVMIAVKSILGTLNSLNQMYVDAMNAAVQGGITMEQLSKRPTDKFLHVMRMYHMSGIIDIFAHTLVGMQNNLCLKMGYIYRDLQRMPSTHTAISPIVFQSFYNDLKKGKTDRLGILKDISCASAPINKEILEHFHNNGFSLVQGYGMTESFGVGTVINYTNLSKINSVGRARPDCTIRIIDGEICIRTDSCMIGYYKDPEATAEVLIDGWLHTGDLGYMDGDGYVYITGRKKNLIILSSGENVSPEELEKLLLRNPAVKEAIAKEKNDRICTEIFCEEGDREAVQAYITECNRDLPLYKRMMLTEFRSEPFPRTASGKIKRT